MTDSLNINIGEGINPVIKGISNHSGKIAIGAMVIGVALLFIAAIANDVSSIKTFCDPLYDSGTALVLLSLVFIAVRACKKREPNLIWAAAGTVAVACALLFAATQWGGATNWKASLDIPLYDTGMGLLASAGIMFIARVLKKKSPETEQSTPLVEYREPKCHTRKFNNGTLTMTVSKAYGEDYNATIKNNGDLAIVDIYDDSKKKVGGEPFLFAKRDGDIALWDGSTTISEKDPIFGPALLASKLCRFKRT